MKIHLRGLLVSVVAYASAVMLHTEVLHLVTDFLQIFSQPENITFRASVWIEKFVYHQDFHYYLTFFRLYCDISVPTSACCLGTTGQFL